MAENFRTQILNSKDSSVSTHAPVRTLGSCTFMYLRHSDLYILMVTKNNANTMMAFKYMTSVSTTIMTCTSAAMQRQFVQLLVNVLLTRWCCTITTAAAQVTVPVAQAAALVPDVTISIVSCHHTSTL